MASFNFGLKPVPNKQGKHTIVINLIKDRKNTSISLRKSVFDKDWEVSTERVKKSNKDYKRINRWIETLAKRAQNYVDYMNEHSLPFNLDSWKDAIKKKPKEKGVTFKSLSHEIVMEMKRANQRSNASLYLTTSNKYLQFCGKDDVTFNEITYATLSKFQSAMVGDDLSSETIKCYLTYVRSIYNEAIKREIVPKELYPFAKFKIKVKDSSKKKEYLTKKEMENFIQFELKDERLKFARDMFVLSYYSYGCNLIDLAKLTQDNFQGENDISYRRTKTGVYVIFPITAKSRHLWESMRQGAYKDYLLPLSKFDGNPNLKDGVNYYKNLSRRILKKRINPHLKTICNELGIDKHITFYCARHTFATHMKLANINIDIIRQSLGHKSIATTAHYLHQLPSNMMMEQMEGAYV